MSIDRRTPLTTEVAAAPQPTPSGEVSPYALLRVLLHNRLTIVATAVGVALLLVAWGLLGGRRYTVEATFMPQAPPTRNTPGGLAALAGQFGLSLTTGEPAQSPAFYVELLRSRALLGRILTDTFTIPAEEGADFERGTVADIFDVRASSAAVRRERTLRALTRAVTASISRETGIVHVGVTTRWPSASRAITERLIALVNEFNLESRQSNAAAERQFVAGRLAETEAVLAGAENALRDFLDANRQYQNSPQLQFERDRLQRQVTHQQELYTGLQEALENARIGEVRDTPVITVIQAPEQPVYPDSRRLARRGILGLIVGLMLGVAVALGAEYLRHPSTREDEEYLKLRAEWARIRKPFSARRHSPSVG
jgi:uncharacterized protein involved in exopolysaccharide biosynthesis